jgi:pimeloyl-ACP methyl ester carboxylesterase
MEAADEQYKEGIRKAEEKLLHFFRTLETLQEEMQLARITDHQAHLREAVGDIFTLLNDELSALSAPEPLKGFHSKFSKAVACCADAYKSFLSGSGPDFAPQFLQGRHSLCTGQYLLYEVRAELTILQQYWVLPAALPSLAELETKTPGVEVPVGFIHKERANHRAEYSLYVPENYTPQKTWPLIVCLHGGYGRADDYILTWLRPAKSKGYLLLSAKSMGPTWSALNPAVDLRSTRAMLEEVFDTYAVDRNKVYLSGLSDGGIFTYFLGLAYADIFAGIAPVAGELHPMVDEMLRQRQGKELPILIVHGAHDTIFPVQFTRQTNDLLTKLGYNVTYKELPDWGHAYTYTINETIVLPWFESLGARPDPQEKSQG